MDKSRIKDGKKVDDNFVYSSDLNDEWMSEKDLEYWLENNYQIGKD